MKRPIVYAYIAGLAMLLCLTLSACSSSTAKASAESTEDTHAEHPEDEGLVALLPDQLKAVDIRLGHIEHKELTATVRANGVLRVPPSHRASITSLYGGTVHRLSVQVGDKVRQGQVLATIANPQFVQLQEDYLTTSAQLIQAEQELRRQEELQTGSAGVMKNLQAATASLRTLRARRASLSEQLRLLGISASTLTDSNLRSTIAITSPISGTVSAIRTSIGAYADATTTLMEVVDNRALHLDLHIYERDLPQLQVGQTIHFTQTNSPLVEYDAKVYSIGSSFENESKTIAVHCEVEGDKSGLIDGMNITALISLGKETSPAIPTEAIVEADGKFYIFAVVEHDHEAMGEHTHSDEVVFRRIEVFKGVTELGYTAITLAEELPVGASIAVKNAFFINAKLSGGVGHSH